MSNFSPILKYAELCAAIFVGLIVLQGCDFSARSDLKRAEKLLKEADAVNARLWAEKEYRKAQTCFEEAMDLSRERKINEARDKATEAIGWAEEAISWSLIRAAEMEKEKERLGSYSD